MTELVLGTKKGLFVLSGEPGSGFAVAARHFAGEQVDFAMRDPRSGRLFAAVGSPFYGPKLFYLDDPDSEWTQAQGLELPAGGDQALARLWIVTPGEADGLLYAGGDPGVLFREPRRRCKLGAQPGAVDPPHALGVAAGRRRAVPALDRAVAR